MTKKITVIGGSGFVGTSLCKQLALKKKDFEIIDLKTSLQFPHKCKLADICDIQSLRDTITGDVLVHLAAAHTDDIADKCEYQRTNIEGTINIIQVCRELKINKIIFTSTVAVYGFAKPGTDEKGKINPFNDYGQTKFEAEERLREWQSEGKNSLIIVRPTVIFGEGNRGNVYNLFKHISSGKFIMIGKGENKKSMAYVENVVSFLERCIDSNQKNGLYNYVDTPDLKMKDLVSLVRLKLKGQKGVGLTLPYFAGLFLGYLADLTAKITRKKLPISSIRVKKFASSTEFRSSQGKLDNFESPYSLKQGIERTLHSEFFSSNIKT